MNVVLFLLVVILEAAAQSSTIVAPRNLLTNTDAGNDLNSWQASGDATVEEFNGNRCFVVRNGGRHTQEVRLPESATPGFLVFVGHGSVSRVDPESGITDRPYLCGLMKTADGRQIVGYNQGETMRSRVTERDVWAKLWGVFEVVPDTSRVTFQMSQGLRRGIPHDGSAARFDDVGLFLFANRNDAEAFVERYR